jgi:hypothetical protein
VSQLADLTITLKATDSISQGGKKKEDAAGTELYSSPQLVRLPEWSSPRFYFTNSMVE